MKEKSEYDLMQIAKSEKYEDGARTAVALELKLRKFGPEPKIEDKKARELRLVKEFLEQKRAAENKLYRAIGLLIFGASCIVISSYALLFEDVGSEGALASTFLMLIGITLVSVFFIWKNKNRNKSA